MCSFPIRIIDINETFVIAANSLFINIPNVTCEHIDLRDIAHENHVFVSPANSLGYMDGGADKVLSQEMFPGIERMVREKIIELGMQTKLGRPYLPVGSAIVVNVSNSLTNAHNINDVSNLPYLITAPTMFLPHDVSSTQNAYHAFMAVLCAMKKFSTKLNKHTLVCPAMCTGYGKMSVDMAAKQMHNAYIDFVAGRAPPETTREDDIASYITASRDDEQPNIYDNREIKTIAIGYLI